MGAKNLYLEEWREFVMDQTLYRMNEKHYKKMESCGTVLIDMAQVVINSESDEE